MGNFDHFPKDWTILKLSEIGNFSKGKGITKSELVENGLPCVRYGEIYTVHHQTIKKFHSFISSATAKGSKKLTHNDLLFAGSGETLGEIGKAVAYRLHDEAYAGGDVIIMQISKEFRADYIAYFLNSIGRNQLNKLGAGNSVVHIYGRDLGKVVVALPNKKEQDEVVRTLQTWDTAIEKTEALIAAKEKQFDWLLHNLIIKNRGRGVSSEWHRTHLGNICSVRTGQSAPQDETLFSPKGIPFIRVSSLDYLLGKSNSKKIEYISEETGEKLNFQLFDEGTLVFAKSGMSALQSRIHKLSEPSFIVSHLCALTPKNSITGNYLEYYLKSYHPNQLIQGDGFPSIRTSEISSFPIWLPSLPEQKRIAESLNTARQEIETLKTLADRYRTQKRGLMQKLLTGKWRVKV